MKILIVDDHQLFADALTITLKSFYPEAAITTCEYPHWLLDNRQLLPGFDLLILDQAMPELGRIVEDHLVACYLYTDSRESRDTEPATEEE